MWFKWAYHLFIHNISEDCSLAPSDGSVSRETQNIPPSIESVFLTLQNLLNIYQIYKIRFVIINF
jgi:hypothetical protein